MRDGRFIEGVWVPGGRVYRNVFRSVSCTVGISFFWSGKIFEDHGLLIPTMTADSVSTICSHRSSNSNAHSGLVRLLISLINEFLRER